MTFGAAGGPSKQEAERILRTYADAGGNFLDTAVNYAGGESENLIVDLIGDQRDEFVVASKYSAPLRPGDPNSGGNHRKSLVQALDTSLRRLRTDYIDLYWVHVWEGRTPVEEVMRALDDAVRAGKVLYVGISDTPAWVVAQANTLAELRGWTPFVGLQIEYSLIERTVERELVPMAEQMGLSVLAWGTLGGGLLTGKYQRDGTLPAGEQGRLKRGDRRLDSRNLAIAEAVREVADELGVAPSQVAISWLRHRTPVIPILGARTADQLETALGALDVTVSEDQLVRLDAVSDVPLGFPHDFLARVATRPAYRLASPRPHL
jgi:aryl-alcohol dehydrogenase-like predicted oxidoreductase